VTAAYKKIERLRSRFLQIYSVFDDKFYGIVAIATAPSNGLERAPTLIDLRAIASDMLATRHCHVTWSKVTIATEKTDRQAPATSARRQCETCQKS